MRHYSVCHYRPQPRPSPQTRGGTRPQISTLAPSSTIRLQGRPGKSGTDSELLFLLALARIEAGQPPEAAMQAVLEHTQALMHRLGIAEPLRFAAALSDGEQLLAFRFSSDDRPPTLYVGGSAQGSIVASEPLDAHPEQWQAVPPNTWVRVDRAGASLQA